MLIINKIIKSALLFASGRKRFFYGLLLAIILGAFLGGTEVNTATAASGWSIGNYSEFHLPSGSIKGIVENLLNWLLLIFGFIGIIGFVISGIMYLVSAGDEDQQKKAKKAMYYSIIGVIVGLAGYVILQAAEAMLWVGDRSDVRSTGSC